MKHLFLLSFLLMFPITLMAQSDKHSQLVELYGEGDDFYYSEEYEKAIAKYQEAIDFANQNSLQSDSLVLYARSSMIVSYCNINRFAEAENLSRELVDYYSTNISTTTLFYARMLADHARILNSLEKYEEALSFCDKSLPLQKTFPGNEEHYYLLLVEKADILFQLKEYEKTIVTQIQALARIKEYGGEHTGIYIEELEQLADYYKAVGKTEMQKDALARATKLSSEAEAGYVPEPHDFSDPQTTRKYRDDAAMCARYILNHYLNDKDMPSAVKYVMSWLETSPDVNITVGKGEEKVFKDKKAAPYLFIYLAAGVDYALQNHITTFTFSMYVNIYENLLNYYMANKSLTGSIKILDKLLDTYASDTDKFVDTLHKQFPQIEEDS